MVVMVSGNESSISSLESGIYQVEIQNMHTNATVTQGGKTIEIPSRLLLYQTPVPETSNW